MRSEFVAWLNTGDVGRVPSQINPPPLTIACVRACNTQLPECVGGGACDPVVFVVFNSLSAGEAEEPWWLCE